MTGQPHDDDVDLDQLLEAVAEAMELDHEMGDPDRPPGGDLEPT
jgi:translation elongation factor EF-1beta